MLKSKVRSMSKLIKKSLLFTLGSLTAIGPLTIDLYLPAFNDIAFNLNVSTTDVQYTLTSFLAGLAIGQLIYGPISDRIGRKKPLLFGIFLFVITSVFISLTHSLNSLIWLRFIQALGACVGMVITRAIVRDMFEQKDSAKVFSLIILIMGVAPILAPMIGSQILAVANWRSIFHFLAVFGVLTFIASIFQIKETLTHKIPIRAGFINYYKLFFDRQFLFSAIITGTVSAAMFCYISGSAFIFLNIFKVGPKMYPLLFGANASGFILFSQINRNLLNHFSLDSILKYGLSAMSFFALLLNLVLYFDLGIYFFATSLFFGIAHIGLILPNATAKALEHQKKRAAVASALMGSLQFLISSIGTVLVALYANDTAWPMTIAFFSFCLISLLMYIVGLKPINTDVQEVS